MLDQFIMEPPLGNGSAPPLRGPQERFSSAVPFRRCRRKAQPENGLLNQLPPQKVPGSAKSAASSRSLLKLDCPSDFSPSPGVPFAGLLQVGSFRKEVPVRARLAAALVTLFLAVADD